MKMRNGYISGGAVSVLLVIATGAVVYVTVKINNWWNRDKDHI